MGDDMLSKISGILENPEALEKIKSIAESLGGGSGEGLSAFSAADTSSVEDNNGLSVPLSAGSETAGILAGLNINFDQGRTVALLEAIKPFMRESRALKVNTAIRAVQMMGVLSKLR